MHDIDLVTFTGLVNIIKLPYELDKNDLGETHVFRVGYIDHTGKKVKWLNKMVISRCPKLAMFRMFHAIHGYTPREISPSFLRAYQYLFHYPLKHHYQYPYAHQLYNTKKKAETLLVHHGIHNSNR